MSSILSHRIVWLASKLIFGSGRINNSNVEALIFDFYHFYGNISSYLNSPGWYRSEARNIKNAHMLNDLPESDSDENISEV